jgi:hypothetical protein
VFDPLSGFSAILFFVAFAKAVETTFWGSCKISERLLQFLALIVNWARSGIEEYLSERKNRQRNFMVQNISKCYGGSIAT